MKSYKIIFLDIDGVLNSAKFSEEHYKQTGKPLFMFDFLDPDAVAKLVKFLERHPEVRLVISSSWRSGNYKEDIEFFSEKGTAPLVPYIVGVTGRSGDLHRGFEINHFLSYHNEEKFKWMQGEPFVIEEYVVVDDDDFDISENLLDNFVHVDSNVGLTDEDYEKIETVLHEEKKYFKLDEAIEFMEKRIRKMFNKN